MKKIVLLLCGALFLLAGCKKQSPQELIVLAAASLTDSLNELGAAYEKETGTPVLFSYASSGTLQAQIEAGVQADVFVSAAVKQMDALVAQNLIAADSVVPLLKNALVLVTNRRHGVPVSSFEDVLSPSVALVGLGDPAHVPAGQYAQTVFKTMGIWDAVAQKANYGADVRTVLSWVEQNVVDVGVVYATDASVSPDVTVLATVPKGLVQDVIYPAGIVSSSAHTAESQRFIDFLQAESSRAVFERYGFSVVAQ